MDQQTAALAYLIGYTRGTVGKYSNKLKLGMHAYDRRNPSSSVVFYLMVRHDHAARLRPTLLFGGCHCVPWAAHQRPLLVLAPRPVAAQPSAIYPLTSTAPVTHCGPYPVPRIPPYPTETMPSPCPHTRAQATRDSSKGHLQTSTLTLTVATTWKGAGRFFMALVIFATAYDLFCTVSAVRLTYLQGRTLVSYLFPRCEALPPGRMHSAACRCLPIPALNQYRQAAASGTTVLLQDGVPGLQLSS